MNIDLFLKNNEIHHKGGTLRKGKNNRTMSQADITNLHHEWLKWEPTTLLEVGEFTKEINAWAEFQAIQERTEMEDDCDFKFPTVHTDLELIHQAIAAENIEVRPDGQIFKDGYSQSIKTLEIYVVVYSNRYNTDSWRDGKKMRTTFLKDSIKDELKRYTNELDILKRNELREKMIYDPLKAPALDAICDYILEKFNTQTVEGIPVILNREMLKHWMWQTKRFIHGLKVPAPILLNIQGLEQETGKSFFIKALTEPITGFITEADLSHMADERQAERWVNYYVVMLEELNFGSMDFNQKGSAISAMKNRITADVVTHRELGTHNITTRARTYSPIGSSNSTLSELIVDHTGMRRFYELHVEAKKDEGRIEDIKHLPAMDMWEGIDHNLERGYVYQGSELYLDLVAVQETYKRAEMIDHPLSHMDEMELPISIHNDKAIDIIKALDEDPDFDLKESGFELIPLIRFRKTCIDWVDDNMGRGSSRFIPSESNLFTSLKIKGYVVVKHQKKKNRFSVLVSGHAVGCF